MTVTERRRATGPGAALRIKIGLAEPVLREANQRLWQTPPRRERYLGYLAIMHAITRASVPLMAAAARHCDAGPVGRRLSGYLEGHIGEETGHDDWVLADLSAAGADPARVLERPPPADVAALVGAQYYWLEHYHPVTVLGYIAVLEGNPPEPGLIGQLAEVTGLPPAAFRALASHAELDPGHGRQVFELLDDLPLSRAHEQALGSSALHTIRAVTRIVSALAA